MRAVLACALLATLFCLPAEAAKPRRKGPAPKPAPPVSGTLDATVPSLHDKVPISFHAEGEGSPAIVFIHCWSCDQGYWRNQVPVFATTHRVVTLDLAGHGASPAERKAYTIAAYGQDVRSVVEHLRLPKVILVGHSMGGDVMLEAARAMPGRVIGLVAVDTLHDADDNGKPEEREGFLKPLRADFRGTTEGLVRNLFPKDADPALVQQVVDDMTAAPPEVGVGSMESLLAYDLAAGLRRTRVPIIAINSDLFPTQVANNRKYAKRFELVTLAGLGHFPHLEKPEAFNEALRAAVEKLSKAPAPAKKRRRR